MDVTKGWSRVTSGADVGVLWRGAGLIVALATGVIVLNTLTSWVDKVDARRWEPVLWEVSSLIGLISAIWIPWLAAAKAHPDQLLSAGWGPRLHFVAVHSVGLVAYTTLHILVFVAVRMVAYAAVGEGPYIYDGALAEFRKDMLAYMLFLSAFWTVAEVHHNAQAEVRPVSFDIRDGARIIRVPVNEILAVASAGNYVEFHIADGRKPLMRATLAAVEERLRAVGFVRSHRSWLVNPTRVTGLAPLGSGDWNVSLGTLEVPLSRRYPEALVQLKDAGVEARTTG